MNDFELTVPDLYLNLTIPFLMLHVLLSRLI